MLELRLRRVKLKHLVESILTKQQSLLPCCLNLSNVANGNVMLFLVNPFMAL